MRRSTAVVLFTTGLILCLASRLSSSDIRVPIYSGELRFDSSVKSHKFSFDLPDECLAKRYCYIIRQIRSNDPRRMFSCDLATNGNLKSGGGTMHGWGTFTASGSTTAFFRAGRNTIEFVHKTETDKEIPATDEGTIRGIGILFSDIREKFLPPARTNFSESDAPSYCWYRTAIHGTHTTFDDGGSTVAECAKDEDRDVRVLCVTAHLDWLDKKLKPSAPFWKLGIIPESECIGLDNFVRACEAATVADRLLVLPTLEIGATRKEGKGEIHSHTLGLGMARTDEELSRLVETLDSQGKIIRRIQDLGWMAVAAHPAFVLKAANRLPWELSNYTYDTRPDQCRGVNGIEYFNNAGSGQFDQELNFGFSFQKRGIFVLATAGQDNHSKLDPKYKDRKRRLTGVAMKELTPEAFFEGVRFGRTWASNGRVFLNYADVLPGLNATKTTAPTIDLWFDPGSTKGMTGQIYRDGELVPLSKLTIEADHYLFVDSDASRGRHLYQFVIWDEFVLSPIVFQVE